MLLGPPALLSQALPPSITPGRFLQERQEPRRAAAHRGPALPRDGGEDEEEEEQAGGRSLLRHLPPAQPAAAEALGREGRGLVPLQHGAGLAAGGQPAASHALWPPGRHRGPAPAPAARPTTVTPAAVPRHPGLGAASSSVPTPGRPCPRPLAPYARVCLSLAAHRQPCPLH